MSPRSKLEALFLHELEIYKTVVRLFPPITLLGTNPGPAESLLLRFLDDFHDMVGANSMSDTSDAEIVRNLLRNQLAIYRTIWRFGHYIKEIARLPAEDIGVAYNGKSLS